MAKHSSSSKPMLAVVAALTLLAGPVTCHLGPTGSRHPVHQARHAQLKRRDFLPHSGPSAPTVEASNVPVAVNNYGSSASSDHALTIGRYGHSAAYVEGQNKVLFIGGQVGESGNYVTNDIVALDLSQPYPCATNPAPRPALSSGLPPHAWAASAVDDRGRIWMIGGVTEDCTVDPLATVLDLDQGTWSTIDALPVAPPRRRQAMAIAMDSPSGNLTADIHVWGGIAEQHTCSSDTVGYMALDTWGTSDLGNVTSRPFVRPNDAEFSPPISDYTVVRQVLGQVVFLGGQRADGTLATFDQIMVYHTLTDEWELKVTTGVVPSARMGHVAFAISDSQLLIHGGVGADDVPTPEMWLLDTGSAGPWSWSKPAINELSLPPPNRAWHTATWTTEKLLVIGYGIDTVTSTTSSDIFFLRREDDNSWTWCSSYSPDAPLPVVTSSAVSTMPSPVVKAATTMAWSPAATDAWATPISSAPVVAVNNADTSDAQASNGETVKAVVGSVGGVLGAALIIGLIGVYLRKRAADQSRRNSVFSPGPPVSALQYTRPAHQRNLSLGSTLTARGGTAGSPAGEMRQQQPIDQADLLDFLYPTSSGGSTPSDELDPFRDGAAVDGSPRSVPTVSAPSVASIPYLTALPMSSARTASSTATVRGGNGGPPAIVVDSPGSDDHFTHMPPSRTRSVRRVSASRLAMGGGHGEAPQIMPLPPSSPFALKIANSPAMPPSSLHA